jgi:hypothetical protein
MSDVLNPAQQTRMAVRRHARVLVRDALDAGAHMARLQAALGLAGAEPAQGALADIFVSFGAADAEFKRDALQAVQPRLASHVVRWFEAQTAQAPLPKITTLATRWSVIAHPSADISTRARRCSVDDSRALADQMLLAVEKGDAQGQQEFLHHCITCHDNLAFMLARRALLRSQATMPPGWEEVSLQLEQAREFA